MTINLVDYQSDVSPNISHPTEAYANAFAMALLMPAGHVREWWAKFQDVEFLAHKFQVSPKMMGCRLRDLGLLPVTPPSSTPR